MLTQPVTLMQLLPACSGFVEAPYSAVDASLIRASHLWVPGSAVWLRASGQKLNYNIHLCLEYTNTDRTRRAGSSSCIVYSRASVPAFMQTSHVFWGILSRPSHQTPLLLLQACQLWLSKVSGMNRQRPISLPSLFLTVTTQRNLCHLQHLQWQIDCWERFLSSSGSLRPSPRSVFWRLSAMCIHCPQSSYNEAKGVRHTSPVVVRFVLSSFRYLQWAHLRWEFEEWNELWTTRTRLTVPPCSASPSPSLILNTPISW